MQRAIGQLSAEELEGIIERTIGRRLQVWLTQLADALLVPEDEEDDVELRPEFVASLRRSLAQSGSGQGVDLETFRERMQR